jgi:hypothetical protein
LFTFAASEEMIFQKKGKASTPLSLTTNETDSSEEITKPLKAKLCRRQH